LKLNFIAPFVILYILVRVVFSKIKRFIPFLTPQASVGPEP